MDVPQLISALAVIGGIAFAIIKGWSILHERQKQHWVMLNQHADLLTKLSNQISNMPKGDSYVKREDCEKNKNMLESLKATIQQLNETIIAMQMDMKRQAEKTSEDRIKMGSYVAKFETLLDERTERRTYHG